MIHPPPRQRAKDKPSPDSMTLTQHLGELRHRLMVCVIAVVITTLVCVIAYEPILHFLLRPLCSVYATTSHHGAGNGSLLVGTRHLQPLRHLAPRRAHPAGQDRRVRRAGPRLAGHPLPVVALHHPGPAGEGAQVGRPLRRRRLQPLPASARRRPTSPFPTPWPSSKSVGGPQPAGHLRPHPVPRPDPADDDACSG